MGEIGLFETLPKELTYPDTHKQIFEIVKNKIK